MATPSAVQAALDRLASFYNGNVRTDSNPGGFDGDGHVRNFIPSLRDTSAVGVFIADAANRFEAAVAAIEAGPVTSVVGKSGAVAADDIKTAIGFDALETDLRQDIADAIAAIPVQAPIDAIVMTAPADGATNIPAYYTFAAGAVGYAGDTVGFYSLYGYPQASRTLNIYQTASPSVIWKTVTVTGAGAAVATNIQTLGLATSTQYLAELVFTDVKGNTTKSPKVSFTTAATFKPTVGQAYGGGTYFADHVDAGSTYMLIASDKSTEVTRAWSTESVLKGGTFASRTNGKAPTDSLAGNSAYPAFAYCYGLVSGNQDDWYLGGIDEYLKFAQANPNMPSGQRLPTNGLWTSTEIDASNAKRLLADLSEASGSKSLTNTVRAIRRELLTA